MIREPGSPAVEVEVDPLPVGERFAELFRAWADREVDFTRR